ncbi:MAG: hypothetical protein QXK89_11185 [Candidatus Bathyarchaeia archaeon]
MNSEERVLQQREQLKQWLQNLITAFREEIKKLTSEEQIAVSRSLVDLTQPCQMLVIWAKEPEFQIIFVIHLSELEDKYIEVYGPTENDKLIVFIEEYFLKSPIIKFIGRELVEDFLAHELRIIHNFYGPLKSPPKTSIVSKWLLSPKEQKSIGWLVTGNIQNLDLKETVDGFIKEIISAAKPLQPAPPKEERKILEGFGAYIYPPVWIGEESKPKSFGEKIWGTSFWLHREEKALVSKYKGRPLIVTRDGYIAIGEIERWKALDLLNEIISTLLVCGVEVHAIRDIDLGESLFTESGAKFSWNPISSRAWLHYPETLLYHPFPKRAILSEEKVSKMIKLAELLTSDSKVKTLLLLFLEAYTYFINTEYKQALILSWIILEDYYIKDLWLSITSKITPNERRQNKLASWKTDERLEALNISHILTNEEYDLLMKIKDARNDVVHEGKIPPKEIVEECLKFASKVTIEFLGRYLGEKLPSIFG